MSRKITFIPGAPRFLQGQGGVLLVTSVGCRLVWLLGGRGGATQDIATDLTGKAMAIETDTQ